MSKKIIIGITACLIIILYFFMQNFFSVKPIRIGILHSLTGTMAISENSVVDATLMAVKEINEQGGVLGRPIEAIVVDGKSDWPTFAHEAERLITQDKVQVIFGCWTSASRKTVKPVLEKYDHLLFYPVQYEGIEASKNIIYTGASPNQQIVPSIFWAFKNLGTKFFLVGSDYVFPRVANTIIKAQVASLGGKIVGEEYIPLGGQDVIKIIKKIQETKPDVILNTINGDTNIVFFKELRKRGITPSKIPTISFSISENELLHLDLQDMIGDYAAWNYFQSINSPVNAKFLVDIKKLYPTRTTVSDPMEAAYFGVYLWARAASEAHSVDPKEVRKVIGTQSFPAPEGTIYIDPENNHTWKFVRIGKIRFDGQISIVWDSEKQIKPEPFLPFKNKDEWEKLLKDLYEGWGKKWAK